MPSPVEHLFFPADWKLLKGQGLCLTPLAFDRGPGKRGVLIKYMMDD